MENKGNKSWLTALIIGISIVLSCCALAFGLLNFRSNEKHTISATGSASQDFESDLIIWRGSFSAHANTSAVAYESIKDDADRVRAYLMENGVNNDEIVFNSVDISQRTKDVYDDNGNYTGYVFDGYDLYQSVVITSKDVDKVEKISRDISSLLESGIEFNSSSPEYYCTTLDSVKLDLIDKASANARERISIIADNSDAQLGKLTSSSLGVFQITAQNSGTSGYAYDGAFDTSSRMKTASITVRLEYSLK